MLLTKILLSLLAGGLIGFFGFQSDKACPPPIPEYRDVSTWRIRQKGTTNGYGDFRSDLNLH